jgi:hypothetical protein
MKYLNNVEKDYLSRIDEYIFQYVTPELYHKLHQDRLAEKLATNVAKTEEPEFNKNILQAMNDNIVSLYNDNMSLRNDIYKMKDLLRRYMTVMEAEKNSRMMTASTASTYDYELSQIIYQCKQLY